MLNLFMTVIAFRDFISEKIYVASYAHFFKLFLVYNDDDCY